LFDGKSMNGWRKCADGSPAEWNVSDGVMTIVAGKGSIYSETTFRDAHIHLEFMCPVTTALRTNGYPQCGNSGVYIHGCYEVQILDSYGKEPVTYQTCGSIYDTIHAPLENASLPCGVWQTYDIICRAPRFEDGRLTENAFATVILNGCVVQNNSEIVGCTPSGLYTEVVADGPLMLQAHDDVVHFRNIWIAKL